MKKVIEKTSSKEKCADDFVLDSYKIDKQKSIYCVSGKLQIKTKDNATTEVYVFVC